VGICHWHGLDNETDLELTASFDGTLTTEGTDWDAVYNTASTYAWCAASYH